MLVGFWHRLSLVPPSQIEDGVLASFSKSLGVTSYRQLQADVAAAKEKREATLREVNVVVAQLRQQVPPCH